MAPNKFPVGPRITQIVTKATSRGFKQVKRTVTLRSPAKRAVPDPDIHHEPDDQPYATVDDDDRPPEKKKEKGKNVS